MYQRRRYGNIRTRLPYYSAVRWYPGFEEIYFDTIVVDGNRTGATCPPNVIGVGCEGLRRQHGYAASRMFA